MASVKLTVNEQIAEIIYQWLHRDQVTHVLFFWDQSKEYREDYMDIAHRCLEVAAKQRHSIPEIGALKKCLVCAKGRPWGIFDETTGASVCKICRDKAQSD